MKDPGSKANESIRIEAYLLSEKAGHPAGMEAYFWQEAELLVASRSEKSAPKRLAAKGKAKAAKPVKAAKTGKKKKS
jgi:hypothetical protein